jgi:hypothetical protein
VTNPAVTADLESRWRTLSDQEIVNGETFLDDAWRILRRRISTLEADIAADTTGDLRAEAIRVMATAVLRVMKNPDGKRQESIDDYAWTRDQAVSAGLLYFSDDELNGLIVGGGGPSGAFSFSLIGTGYPDNRFPA